jgi:hypothetical protein
MEPELSVIEKIAGGQSDVFQFRRPADREVPLAPVEPR